MVPWLVLCSAVACGGSSSETPPPLEPDPERLLAAAPAAESTGTSEVVPALPANGRSRTARPRTPGQAPTQTWGEPNAQQPSKPPSTELAPAPDL